MQYTEYGKENEKAIILLHGGGLSCWNYAEAARVLQTEYHVILPILDGHAGSDRDFTTIEESAQEIIAFAEEHLNGRVFLLGGLSLGAQIVLEILSRRQDICQYAWIESALVIPSKLTAAMIRPVFGSCYGLIRQKWFSILQFRYLRIREELFEAYYRDTCAITKENMIAFLKANSLYTLKDPAAQTHAKVHIFVGEKESRAMQVSAKAIHQKLPDSCLHILNGLYHGEYSINYGRDYAGKIKELTG